MVFRISSFDAAMMKSPEIVLNEIMG